MCYSLTLLEPDTIQLRYAAAFPSSWEFQPTYYTNAFTYPEYPILANNDKHRFQIMKWGLIPFWVKKNDEAEKLRNQTMNARSETIFDKPSFRYSIKKKRCLIPASGFFEWRFYKGKNYPYFIHLKNNDHLSIAGIWDQWINPETNTEILTFSVITCNANPLMEKIHNKKKRMPVILRKETEIKWLQEDLTKKDIQGFLTPFPDEEMEGYTISRLVTSETQNRNVLKVLQPYHYPELKSL
jgi:putative SOS response-associated peptidase YedK